jgi:anti-sigma-K factor RskA
MGSEHLHELSAAYALDALGPQEREEFEGHLSTCEACRADVAAFTETAAALAYAAPPANPPARLRADILRRAAEDRPAALVLPFRRRRVELALSTGLAAAAAAAIVLGIWAGSLHGKVGQERSALRVREQAVAILGDPLASRRALKGAGGELVVNRSGSGVLAMQELAPPPAGKTYEAWVITGGSTKPAGVFSDGQAVLLTRAVARGATVAVTVEPAGGSLHPTHTPFASSAAV